MTATCSAPMHIEPDVQSRILDGAPQAPFIAFGAPAHRAQDEGRGTRDENRARGFTFTELIVVVVMISLFVLMVQLNLLGLLRKSTFKAQVNELVSVLQMAASAAAESDRRYEVIIDIPEQSFMLRQITTPDLSEVLEEEIIAEHSFNDTCRIAYVLFDDGEYTNQSRAKFRAGHSGWQYGGKIVLLDEDQKPYTVIVNRINRIVTHLEGEVEVFMPRTKDELPF